MGQRMEVGRVFVLARAVVYATLFISLVLVLVPTRLLSWSGVSGPAVLRLWQLTGMILTVAGGALALWCVLTFAWMGQGTPAPFDPPRRLVVRGPYAIVRNPMYLGAVLALAGAALFYESGALATYSLAFLLATHAFVRWYEEPALRARFGPEYDAYCRRVGRWWPHRGIGAT